MAENKKLKLYTVDAFAERPFSGNPAAVVLLDKPYNEIVYRNIAAEMNLSETSFVIPVNSSESFSTASKYDLRWFTPTSEAPLCGHATLATAHVLFNECGNANDILSFQTQSGEVTCKKETSHIRMDFPQYYPKEVMPETFPKLFNDRGGHLEWFGNLIKEASNGLSVESVHLCPKDKAHSEIT